MKLAQTIICAAVTVVAFTPSVWITSRANAGEPATRATPVVQVPDGISVRGRNDRKNVFVEWPADQPACTSEWSVLDPNAPDSLLDGMHRFNGRYVEWYWPAGQPAPKVTCFSISVLDR